MTHAGRRQPAVNEPPHAVPSHAAGLASSRERAMPEATFLSRVAACRTRSSALSAPFRLGVRGAFCWRRFPLARPLPSASSATGCPALFGDFIGTTGLSDFLWPFIVGVRP
jgi:hypothetical protein